MKVAAHRERCDYEAIGYGPKTRTETVTDIKSRTSVCARRTRVVESAQCLGLQGDTFVPEKTSTNEYLAILCEQIGFV